MVVGELFLIDVSLPELECFLIYSPLAFVLPIVEDEDGGSTNYLEIS